MPAYNSEHCISDSIESIQKQTYTNWELLITDDCSTDNTIKIINSFVETDNRIKLFTLKKNSGAGLARNRSIKESIGKYISFCDSDDMWIDFKLEKQLKFMKVENLVFTYSSYFQLKENKIGLKKIDCPEHLTKSKILKNNYVGCLTAIYDSEKLGKLYMPSIRKRQDWALWINILYSIKETKGLKEPLAVYRKRENSISSNKFKLLKYNWYIYRVHLGFNYVKSLYYMIIFIWNYIKKI